MGTCFMDAYRAVDAGGTKQLDYKNFKDVKIAHGVVNIVNPVTGEKGKGAHGWVELDDKLVHDVGGSGELYYKPTFYQKAGVSDAKTYSLHEGMKEALRTGHYGPWAGQPKFISATGEKTLYPKAYYPELQKFNPSHDEKGEFASEGTTLYHVTHSSNAKNIQSKGLLPMQTSNWVKGEGGERYGQGEIYSFEKPEDAVRWGAKMDWSFNHETGSGKVSVVPIIVGKEKWVLDNNDPLGHAVSMGKWFKTIGKVPAKQLGTFTPIVHEHVQALMQQKPLVFKLAKAQFKYCSTQVNLPRADAEDVMDRGQVLIAEADLAGNGRELDPHVTVKYGVDPNLEALESVLSRFQPFTITLGRVQVFPVSDHSEGTAPVIVEVISPELRQLHDEIGAVIGSKPDDFPYQPHLTLAYVSPDAASKYAGDDTFEGLTILVSSIALTDLDGEQVEVALGGMVKFNPNHDEKGEFSSKGASSDFQDLLDSHNTIRDHPLRMNPLREEDATKMVLSAGPNLNNKISLFVKENSKELGLKVAGKAKVSLTSSKTEFTAGQKALDEGNMNGASLGAEKGLMWQHQAISDISKSFSKLAKAEDDEESFADQLNDIVSEEWLALPSKVRESILASFNAGIEKGVDELGISDGSMISSLNQTARDWAADRAAELVGMRYDVDGDLVPNPDAKWAISDTTRERIREIVAQAFEDETRMGDLVGAIQSAGIFSDSRALMIAEQETKQAQTSGNYESWKRSGLVEKLRWIMSSSHDVDDVCDENDGVVVNLGEPFPSGDYYPGAHIGCECSAVPAAITGVEL